MRRVDFEGSFNFRDLGGWRTTDGRAVRWGRLFRADSVHLLTAGDVERVPSPRTVTRAGREIDLAPKELAVLEVLMAADGAVVGPEELLEKAWDDGIDPFTNTVRMTVMTLRRKLGDPPVVHTVRGAGYRV